MTAVGLLIRGALGLGSSDTNVIGNAVLEDLLADEGWHGLCVVDQAWGGAVGATGAGEVEGVLQQRH